MSSATFDIEKLYIEFFNRPADSAGLQYWVNIENGGTSLSTIAHSIEVSPEFQANFTHDLTRADWNTDTAFLHMFDRHAAATELNTWGNPMMNAMVNHTPLSDVIMQIGDAATGADLQHFMQKVTSALPPATLVGVQTFDAHTVHASVA